MKNIVAVALFAICTTACTTNEKRYSDQNLPVANDPANVISTLSIPAESRVGAPKGPFKEPYIQWTYFFESTDGRISPISYFYSDKGPSNTIFLESQKKFRLMDPQNLLDRKKIDEYKRLHGWNETEQGAAANP